MTPDNETTGCAAMGMNCQPSAYQEMPYFVGVKVIQAWPMSRHEFAAMKGNPGPAMDHPGYLVRYPDGYESWSPAEVFKEAYHTMPSKEDAERIALEIKAILLSA